MKLFNLFGVLALLLFPAKGMAQFAWYGADGKAQVETGLGNDTHTQGIWVDYNDNADGGKSKVVWDVKPGEDGSLDNLVKECGGISGNAVLDRGQLDYYPFAGVLFPVVGETSDTDPTYQEGDATAWGGLSIVYSCDMALVVELGLTGEEEANIGYATPIVTLPKTTEDTFVRIPWSDFKMPSWYRGTKDLNGPAAAKQLTCVKFRMQNRNPGSYHFKISAVGSYDMPENFGPVGDVNGDGSVNVADISAVIDVMAGKSLQYKNKADVNNDGNVNVADIAAIIDKMAGKARMQNFVGRNDKWQ